VQRHKTPNLSAILDRRREIVVKTGITVIAYMTAKSGNEDQVREALLDLVARTRKEKGCINYDLHQSRENAAHFVIYENWTRLQTRIRTPNQVVCRRSPELLLPS
jgi:hypothetical protein